MEKHFYIPVSSALEMYVTVIWEVKGKRNVNEIILPQGVVEIVFNFADEINGFLPYSKTSMQAPRCFIQGIYTQIVQASYVGQHHLFGIRLHPHAVQQLLGILPCELNNNTVDLTLIKPAFKTLWHQLVEVNSFETRVALINQSLPTLSQSGCQRTKQLSNLFLADGMNNFSTVDELAREVCYSARQLNRVVHKLFGLSPEELISYKRYMQAVKLIEGENNSLTSIAYDAGFYDQAHFCRSFKSYAGITARQYRERKSDLPFHIFS